MQPLMIRKAVRKTIHLLPQAKHFGLNNRARVILIHLNVITNRIGRVEAKYRIEFDALIIDKVLQHGLILEQILS